MWAMNCRIAGCLSSGMLEENDIPLSYLSVAVSRISRIVHHLSRDERAMSNA